MFVLESRLPDLVATVNDMLAELDLPTDAQDAENMAVDDSEALNS